MHFNIVKPFLSTFILRVRPNLAVPLAIGMCNANVAMCASVMGSRKACRRGSPISISDEAAFANTKASLLSVSPNMGMLTYAAFEGC